MVNGVWTKVLWLISFMLFSLQINAENSRYPDPKKEIEVIAVVQHGKIKCQCDPTDDPCCHPPTGSSSNHIQKHKHMRDTDVAHCHCDANTDPCCKRMPGTYRD